MQRLAARTSVAFQAASRVVFAAFQVAFQAAFQVAFQAAFRVDKIPPVLVVVQILAGSETAVEVGRVLAGLLLAGQRYQEPEG